MGVRRLREGEGCVGVTVSPMYGVTATISSHAWCLVNRDDFISRHRMTSFGRDTVLKDL